MVGLFLGEPRARSMTLCPTSSLPSPHNLPDSLKERFYKANTLDPENAPSTLYGWPLVEFGQLDMVSLICSYF